MSIRSGVSSNRSRSTEYFSCEDYPSDEDDIRRRRLGSLATSSSSDTNFFFTPLATSDDDDSSPTASELTLSTSRQGEDAPATESAPLLLPQQQPVGSPREIGALDDSGEEEEEQTSTVGGESDDERDRLLDHVADEADPDEIVVLSDADDGDEPDEQVNEDTRLVRPSPSKRGEKQEGTMASAIPSDSKSPDTDSIAKVPLEEDGADAEPGGDDGGDEEVPVVNREIGASLFVIGPTPLFERGRKSSFRVHVTCLSLLCVLLFVASDLCLHYSVLDRDASGETSSVTAVDTWFALAVRSIVMIVVGLAGSVAGRQWPWGPWGAQMHLIVVAFFSAYCILGLEFSSRRVSTNLEVTSQLATPLAALVFSITLSLEAFKFLHVVAVSCLCLSGLLLTHPFLFGGGWSNPATPALLSFDALFGFPLSTAPAEDSFYRQCLMQQEYFGACSPSLPGAVSSLLSPVASAYLAVLVSICHGVSVAVALFWMGIGAAAITLYGILSTSSFSAVFGEPSSAQVALSSCGAVIATAATLLLLIMAHRIGVVRTVIVRQLCVALTVAVRIWAFLDRPFALSDVAAMALTVASVSLVVVEILFF